MHPRMYKTVIDRLSAFRHDEAGFTTADFVMMLATVVTLGAAHLHDLSQEAAAQPRVQAGGAATIEACVGAHVADLVVEADTETYIANLQAAMAVCWSGEAEAVAHR